MTTTTRTAYPTRIQKATGADLPRIATTLARAFFDDPVFRWTCPDEQRRRRLLPAFFALIAETLQRHDEIHLSADATGAALWAPPGQPPVSDEQADALGRRLEQIAGVDAERIFAISKLIDEHHPPGSYYFLQFIGVEPTGQGRGTGSALLAQMLERCDQEGARAYLDATSEHNKRLYERHGFLAGAPYAPDGGPLLWPMWREPGRHMHDGRAAAGRVVLRYPGRLATTTR
jgi:ribosomal protein S18 acetylase RimI-like enzyme